MAFNKYFIQKCMFASMITMINVTAISTAYAFSTFWYFVQIPLLLVLFFNISTVLLSIICSIVKKNKKLDIEGIPPTSVGYFIPCYNESALEINNSLESFFLQNGMEKQQQFYFTVCDGRKRGTENLISTDRILKEQIFANSQSIFIKSGYLSAQGTPIDIELLTGICKNEKPYFVLIKEKNQGKRDSIAIMRRLFYAFNTQKCQNMINPFLLNLFTRILKTHGIFNIQFVIGVDADTEFQPNCSIELLRQICRKPSIMATSGMVKVTFPEKDSIINRIWQGYQHVEYLAGQGFMRNQQNLTQQKINCLPGCLNITRVCQQTCGQNLLGQYMAPPKSSNNIFQQIRGTASEDRHSVMLLLKLNQHSHTTVNWHAQAKTAVPNTISVFLSQRRRWSLGSATHGGWMIFMPNIPIWERFSSFIFVLTYLINPFLMYSAAVWIYVMASGHGDTTYYIFTGVVQMVTLYKLCIAIWCPLSCWQRVAYFLFYILYIVLGPFLGIMVLCYSIYNMDDFGWGKTRATVEQNSQLPLYQMTKTNIASTACSLETVKQLPAQLFHFAPQIKHQMNQTPITFRDTTNFHNNSAQPLAPIQIRRHMHVKN